MWSRKTDTVPTLVKYAISRDKHTGKQTTCHVSAERKAPNQVLRAGGEQWWSAWHREGDGGLGAHECLLGTSTETVQLSFVKSMSLEVQILVSPTN